MNLPENFIETVIFVLKVSEHKMKVWLGGRKVITERLGEIQLQLCGWCKQTSASSLAVKMEMKSEVAFVELDFRALLGVCSY